MQQITVLGSGVSGLSSAVRLQQAGYSVRIVTRDMPDKTTSAAAGAIWWGYLDGKARDWALASLRHFQLLAGVENSGVLSLRLRDVYPEPVPEPWFKDLLPHFRHLPAHALPDGCAAGFEMDIPLIEPPVYLLSLLDQFWKAGGELVEADIDTLEAVAHPDTLTINCTGVGARQVAGDLRVYPVRGQTVLVEAPHITQGFMHDEDFTYIFPRGDGVLLGGIAQPGDYSLDPDPAVTQDIMERCQQIEPALSFEAIIGHTVGLRPGRDTVRLEHEQLADGSHIIHNYGHGAVGFTLSWGCAADVVTLAQRLA